LASLNKGTTIDMAGADDADRARVLVLVGFTAIPGLPVASV
jgi:hypothetical protein